MSTTIDYRRIYKNHFGEIPKDQHGRTYEIHHLDGNRKNNEPSNLVAISIQEHYDIHYSQGDWAACHRIAARMELEPELISELSSKAQSERVQAGIHQWLKRPDGTSVASDQVKSGKHHLLKRADGSSLVGDLVKTGKHHLLKRPDGSSLMADKTKQGLNPLSKRVDGTSVASNLVANKKHHFLKRADGTTLQDDRIKNGTHPSQQLWTCEHCNKSGKSITNYTRWHGNNCKTKGA